MTPARLASGTLVFVPGIMGSALRFSGVDNRGVARTDLVWGEDVPVMLKTLGRRPEWLASPDLVATDVIRHMKFGTWRVEQIYGPLLDFCCARTGLDLSLGSTLQPFAYDWRGNLMKTAPKLAAFVRALPEPVFIVAHSMGGVLTRLMLAADGAAAARVQGVFQIGSPVAGSSKAFITLRKYPNLGPIADPLWKLFHNFDPERRARLSNAVANMPALYQLLPPDASKILLKPAGVSISAVDIGAWQARDHGFLADAVVAHLKLKTAPRVPIKCIYGVDLATDWLIAVDDDWNIIATQATAMGDGTVTSASAMAASVDKMPMTGADGEHTRLCARSDVHEALRKFLS